VNEQNVLAQLDKVLDKEREIKRTQLALMIRIKNKLTPDQQDRLAVEQEAAESGLPLEPVDQVIERGNQAGEKRRSREVPFPVPVGVGDQMEGVAGPRADRTGRGRHS